MQQNYYFIKKIKMGVWGFCHISLYLQWKVNSRQFVLKMTAFLSSSTSAAASWSQNYHPSLGCLALWYQLANNLFCWHMIQLGCKTEWLWSKIFFKEKADLPKHGEGKWYYSSACLIYTDVSLLTLIQCNNSIRLVVLSFHDNVNI